MQSITTKQLITTGVTTGSAVVTSADCSNRRRHTFYVVASAGVDAGAVMVETAHDPAYTGTWTPLLLDPTDGSALPVAVLASTVYAIQVEGAFMNLRLRITTTVTNGTITAYYIAN